MTFLALSFSSPTLFDLRCAHPFVVAISGDSSVHIRPRFRARPHILFPAPPRLRGFFILRLPTFPTPSICFCAPLCH